MNLHKVVRGPINAVARDRLCTLYRMTGKQERDERGLTTPVFAPGEEVRAQIQSESAAALEHFERVETTTTTRRIYLYAEYDPALRPWAQWRPLARSGDMLQDDLGLYWLITDVIEDFTHEGWVSVLGVLQTTPVTLRIEEDADSGSDDGEAERGADGVLP